MAPRTAPLKDASRRASAVAPARAGSILDRNCARRLGVVRPGRRNGPFQPNQETRSGGQRATVRQGADVATHVKQRGSKKFYGTYENAVKTQIWIAISVYVLVAIVRKRLKLEVSLYTLMQVISVTVFEKAAIESMILQMTDDSGLVMDDNQLNLFGY